MELFSAFFIIILVGLLSSTLFRRLHFPWVIALILGGLFLGPQGVNMFEIDTTIEFIGQLGLIFLMFMAGLETRLSSFKQSHGRLYILALINGLIPFLVGLGIGYLMGFKPLTIFMIGTVFVSSSIAVVIPALESTNLFNASIGKSVMITSILQDVASLILLSVILQNLNPISRLPLYVFYPALLGTVVLLRILLPKIRSFLSSLTLQDDLFQEELQSVLLILIGTVLIFEFLGLHSIIGGFFAGLVLSDTISDKSLIDKLHVIGYGIFIPTFFILVGSQAQLHTLLQVGSALTITGLILTGSILSKLVSGFLGAKIVGFNNVRAAFFGVTCVPQLSTTLAASYTATQLGVIPPDVNTSFVVLSIVSTLVGPLLMSRFSKASLSD